MPIGSVTSLLQSVTRSTRHGRIAVCTSRFILPHSAYLSVTFGENFPSQSCVFRLCVCVCVCVCTLHRLLLSNIMIGLPTCMHARSFFQFRSHCPILLVWFETGFSHTHTHTHSCYLRGQYVGLSLHCS